MNERCKAMDQGLIGSTGRVVTLPDGQTLDEPEELHTFKVWKSLGYHVKHGEKAIVKTKLWKFRSVKSNEETEDSMEDSEDKSKFILCTAYLFSQSQVER